MDTANSVVITGGREARGVKEGVGGVNSDGRRLDWGW